MNHVTKPLRSADISIFSLGISNFHYIGKCRQKLYFDTIFLIILTFIESIVYVLINMNEILMMSAKLGTPFLLEIKTMTP